MKTIAGHLEARFDLGHRKITANHPKFGRSIVDTEEEEENQTSAKRKKDKRLINIQQI